MRYFMVAFGNLESSDEVKFKDFLGENYFGFWHRIPGAWLLTTPDTVDSSQLLDMIMDQFNSSSPIIAAEFASDAICVSVPDPYKAWFEKHLGLEFDGGDEQEGTKQDHATQK